MSISLEMATDFQNLLATMPPEKFKQMLERSIKAANAASLTVTQEAVKTETGVDSVYVMRFHPATDCEYFLQPDEKTK